MYAHLFVTNHMHYTYNIYIHIYIYIYIHTYIIYHIYTHLFDAAPRALAGVATSTCGEYRLVSISVSYCTPIIQCSSTVYNWENLVYHVSYRVATISRIDKIIGLFCRISSLL